LLRKVSFARVYAFLRVWRWRTDKGDSLRVWSGPEVRLKARKRTTGEAPADELLHWMQRKKLVMLSCIGLASDVVPFL
jgi:hypothetical protein